MANGRVTTKEFYEKLEKVEQRLIARLDKIDSSVQANCVVLEGIAHDIDDHEARLSSHAAKIEKLQDSTKQAGVIASIIAVVGSVIAALVGLQQP